MVNEFLHDSPVITTKTTVVEGWRQVFGSTAGSLVQADDVEPSMEGFGCDPPHVSRFAGAF